MNEKLEARRAELIAVQMKEWPDSHILTLSEVYEQWMDDQGDLDAWVKEFDKYYLRIYAMGSAAYARELSHYIEKRRGEHQLRVARGLALCLQHPVNVFYECGAITDTDEHGDRVIKRYQWRGCRYGTEGREYISGFGRD